MTHAIHHPPSRRGSSGLNPPNQTGTCNVEYSQIMASLLRAYRNIKISTQNTRDALAFHLHHGPVQYKPSRVQRRPLHFFSHKSANVSSILPPPPFCFNFPSRFTTRKIQHKSHPLAPPQALICVSHGCLSFSLSVESKQDSNCRRSITQNFSPRFPYLLSPQNSVSSSVDIHHRLQNIQSTQRVLHC